MEYITDSKKSGAIRKMRVNEVKPGIAQPRLQGAWAKPLVLNKVVDLKKHIIRKDILKNIQCEDLAELDSMYELETNEYKQSMGTCMQVRMSNDNLPLILCHDVSGNTLRSNGMKFLINTAVNILQESKFENIYQAEKWADDVETDIGGKLKICSDEANADIFVDDKSVILLENNVGKPLFIIEGMDAKPDWINGMTINNLRIKELHMNKFLDICMSTSDICDRNVLKDIINKINDIPVRGDKFCAKHDIGVTSGCNGYKLLIFNNDSVINESSEKCECINIIFNVLFQTPESESKYLIDDNSDTRHIDNLISILGTINLYRFGDLLYSKTQIGDRTVQNVYEIEIGSLMKRVIPTLVKLLNESGKVKNATLCHLKYVHNQADRKMLLMAVNLKSGTQFNDVMDWIVTEYFNIFWNMGVSSIIFKERVNGKLSGNRHMTPKILNVEKVRVNVRRTIMKYANSTNGMTLSIDMRIAGDGKVKPSVYDNIRSTFSASLATKLFQKDGVMYAAQQHNDDLRSVIVPPTAMFDGSIESLKILNDKLKSNLCNPMNPIDGVMSVSLRDVMLNATESGLINECNGLGTISIAVVIRAKDGVPSKRNPSMTKKVDRVYTLPTVSFNCKDLRNEIKQREAAILSENISEIGDEDTPEDSTELLRCMINSLGH